MKSSPANTNRRNARGCALLLAVCVAVAVQPASAEEGGGGHYFPGTISSFMDGVAQSEVFIARLNGIYYDGSFSAAKGIPIAGRTALDVDVKSAAGGLTMFWRPSWGGFLGERWSYAMSTTIPFPWVEVAADVAAAGRTVRRKDSLFGLGDILVAPFMLNYNVNDDFNVNGRLNVYTPTGSYEVGRLANLGKNYWTFEPILGLMYLGKQNGREASIFFGADFNTENPDTNYHTGTELHVDGTLAQHFPIGTTLLGAGVTGYWYQQVEGDSGSGATFGSFEGRTNGIGPSVTISHAFGSHNFAAELKWLHEVGVERRPEGDSFILKAMLTF
jgi:hypothetical protein